MEGSNSLTQEGEFFFFPLEPDKNRFCTWNARFRMPVFRVTIKKAIPNVRFDLLILFIAVKQLIHLTLDKIEENDKKQSTKSSL